MVNSQCSIKTCSAPVKGRGWCTKHYQRWQQHGDPQHTLKPRGRLCSFDGCNRPHRAKGYCQKHYRRYHLYGDPTVTRYIMDDEPRRWWSKIDVSGDCWEWTPPVGNHGYGEFARQGERRTVLAHRYAYELLVGPIPDGLEIDHLCRNKACVNPDHLEPVTKSENARRAALARFA